MKRLLMTTVCLTVAVAAFAQMPKPGPELKKLEPFVGDWKCKGEIFTSEEYGPGHAFTGTVNAWWTLSGFWVEGRFAEKKTAKVPEPYDAKFFLSYDGEIKKFVLGSIDNTGTYETAQSDGWQGDTMAFEGPTHTGVKTATARDEYTKKGTTQLDHTFSLKQSDGSWKKIENDHCTRAKK